MNCSRTSIASLLPRASTSRLPANLVSIDACRYFCGSSTTRVLNKSQISARKSMEELADIVDGANSKTSKISLELESQQSQINLLGSLAPQSVIRPDQLRPEKLLNPLNSFRNFAKAHPLGPSAAYKHTHDPFVRLNINPLDSPLNPFTKVDFCTTMGRIQKRSETGLQKRTHRQMAKAVRRARAMGIIPVWGISIPKTR